MKKIPLRYNISDWHQLKDVKSNNSRSLSISVSDFIQNEYLTGLRIQVIHDSFGVLFACMLNAQGTILNEFSENLVVEFTHKQILLELEKYGFLVTYNPRESLSGSQIEYLMSLKKLGYDKIRILNVWYIENGVKLFRWYVVAFNVDKNIDWLNNGYAPNEWEFTESLNNGSAVNISAISKTNCWSWSWLDYIANIDDILEDNA